MVTPIACRWLLECRSCWAPSPCEALVTRIPRGMFSTQMYASPGKGVSVRILQFCALLAQRGLTVNAF